MKPIITIFLSLFISTILATIIILGAIGLGIKQEENKYSKENLQLITKKLSLTGNIKKIKASQLDIIYEVRDTNVVTIELTAKKAAINKIETTLKDGTLCIKFKGNNISHILKEAARIKIVCPSVDGISLSAGADVTTKGTYNRSLNADLSSGSSLKIDELSASRASFSISSGASADICATTADTIIADVSSGASMSMAGKQTCSYVDMDASSGSSIEASKLKAEKGKAEASSGANISCNVKELNSSSTSGGSVENLNK